MKPIISSLFLVVFVFFTCDVNSQEERITSSRLDFFVINNSNNFIQSINQLAQNANIIQVNQMGLGNSTDLNVVSENSNLVVNQYGSNNYIDLYKKSNELLQSVNQSGNNNFISDFSLIDENQINMNVKQDGNNLSLYNNGSNSISKNMKITQTGNSGSIYIFNH